MNLELFAGKVKGQLPKLDTLEDKIAAYEIGLIDDLTDKDMIIRDRWHKLWSKLMNFHSPTQAVAAHIKQCEQEGQKISMRTAWNDYRKATLLWGNLMDTSVKAKRMLVEEYAIKTFQMATNKRDIAEMNRAIANLIKLNGLDRPEADMKVEAGAGSNMYFMAIYTKGADKPKVISLDEMNQISDAQQAELLDAVENEEITDLEIQMLMDAEQHGSKTT